MSKLHNDLINEVDSHESVHASVVAFCNAVADRIDASKGNRVRLSDLMSILRENPEALADAILNNTIEAHAAKIKTVDRATYDAPSPAFDMPREGVRDGMVGAGNSNDHRDQVFPATDRTDVERARMESEQTARDRGQTLTVEKRPEDTDRRAAELADERKRAEERNKNEPVA